MPGSLTIFSSALKAAQPLACRLLETALARGRLANGYLLVGFAVAEKTELVKQIACHLNCRHEQRDQRGSCLVQTSSASFCLNCQWLSELKHPQAWLQLKGEGRSGKVPVEAARLLTAELSKTSACARVVVVADASQESFHRPAANALLKVIEEPPPAVLFFFFADNEQDVLSTIVSRCQVISLGKPLHTATLAGEPASNKNAALDAALACLHEGQAGKKSKGEHYVQTVEGALLLSRHLQEMLKQHQETMDEHCAYAAVLDAVLTSEHQATRQAALGDRAAAAYLQRLLLLVETSRRHNQHYIKPANALDHFCLSLTDLKEAYFGDAGFAKH